METKNEVTTGLMAKIFEIRDSMTFIPVLAVKGNLTQMNESARYLAGRGGWRTNFVYLTKLSGGATNYMPSQWGNNPDTMFVAHNYIQTFFDELEDGSVIDIEFILGKTKHPKESERITEGRD